MSSGLKNHKISIIIPVYNVAEYLEEGLLSLTTQSIGMESIEVIMIDDCSTDNSGQIMENFSEKYDNFVSIHLPLNSGGAGHPRNIGLREATGEFIMFLDSDDKYTPDTCKIMLEAIEQHDSDMVFAGHIYFRTDSEGYFKLVDEAIVNTSLLKNPKLLCFPPVIWAKIYRKEMLLHNNINFPDTAIGEDAVFFFKCLLNANKVTVLPVYIYKYRIRGGIENPSLTQIISNRFFNELNNTRKLLLEIAEQHQFDYLAQKFHQEIDYTLWMLNKSELITKEEEITPILEDLYWLVVKGEKYLPNCRISDTIIVKKILEKDFTGAAKAFLSFSDFRELERVIVEQQKEIEAFKAKGL